jgi:pyruvate,orthophosphate dikinase
MEDLPDICALDYLVGTLATAYKGSLQSLICRDFCIKQAPQGLVFTGRILALPSGNIQACLIQSGIEIDRAPVVDGIFELNSERDILQRDSSLQIDILQEGRHIGTFLLKQISGSETYISAIELSEDLRGLNMRLLHESIRSKPGLNEKAEKIISFMASTKKDWKQIIPDLTVFMNDLFWYKRDAFYLWFDPINRILLRALKTLQGPERERAVRNLTALAELVSEKEEDPVLRKNYLSRWSELIVSERVEPGLNLKAFFRIIPSIQKSAPRAVADELKRFILHSLARSLEGMPVISREPLDILGKHLPHRERLRISLFLQENREKLIREISGLTSGIPEEPDEGIEEALTLIETDPLEVILSGIIRACDSIERNDLIYLLTNLFRFLKPIQPEGLIKNSHRVRSMLTLFLRNRDFKAFSILLDEVSSKEESIRREVLLSEQLGEEILSTEDRAIRRVYLDNLKKVFIPPPSITGTSEETWAWRFNREHLSTLKSFMKILSLGLPEVREILIGVACNLAITDVYIPDEALFQRQITEILNSSLPRTDFLPLYLLIKQLPVFFNDVGASGNLRDLSTEIDSWGNDPLLYFLRKQIHVNASPRNIDLVKSIMETWVSGETLSLAHLVPDEILQSIDPGKINEYSGPFRLLLEERGLLVGKKILFKKLATLPSEVLKEGVSSLTAGTEVKKKVLLLILIFQEVLRKYSLLSASPSTGESIPSILDEEIKKIAVSINVIKDEEQAVPQESLYFKRHIAFGIPSVIGSYHEQNFDAMKEMLIAENRISLLIEDFLERMEGPAGEEKITLSLSVMILDALSRLLELLGLGNQKIEENVVILRNNVLETGQMMDILRMIQKELTWQMEVLYREFHPPFRSLLDNLPESHMPEHLRRVAPERTGRERKLADILIRKLLGRITGLEELDRVLNRLIQGLETGTIVREPDEMIQEGRGKDRTLYLYDETGEDEAILNAPRIGSKALNLILLKKRGLPVPPGAVFSASLTENSEKFFSTGEADRLIRKAVSHIEELSGLNYGKSERPLFLSVRSGSYVSMPGILSSILYVGFNEETLAGFVRYSGNGWLALDSYRRFIEHYGTVVFGLEEKIFDLMKEDVLHRRSLSDFEDLDGPSLKDLITRYLKTLTDAGFSIPEDPYLQLRESINGVYRSWLSDKAVRFRRAMGISDSWGTAVTLMQMIYGNDRGAGAAVFFTRKPFTMEKGIYGEIREAATGDDIVYGRINNRPISRDQDGGERMSLEETDPSLFSLYNEIAGRVEDTMGGLPQEVESAYIRREDSAGIYILQTKRMEFHRGYTDRFHDVCRMESNIIGRGIGVHGGALSGVASFSEDPAELKRLRDEYEMPVILLRTDTSTDDASLMPDLDGLITARGGATSHAAILAQKFDLTAVVGCRTLEIKERPTGERYGIIGGMEFNEGDQISLDGATGIIYSGVCTITEKRDGF